MIKIRLLLLFCSNKNLKLKKQKNEIDLLCHIDFNFSLNRIIIHKDFNLPLILFKILNFEDISPRKYFQDSMDKKEVLYFDIKMFNINM